MFFELEDGTVIKMSSVVAVTPVIGDGNRAHYEIMFDGGHHEVVKEHYKSRASFLVDWQGA